MTRQAYLDKLLDTYAPVAVLSEKNGGRVLRLRHRTLQKDLVLRSYPTPQPAYEPLATLQCENLPLIYDVQTLEDGQIVLEEYIEGLSVAQVMETGRYRPLGAKKVLKQVCTALQILHKLGFVHRDVKPENVMISRKGRVVLIDFNAARKVSPGKKDTEILGTVGYAAPEQMGVAQSDARTDIYALGVLYNVMLTGDHPSRVIAKGRAGQVIRKCTAVNPEDRYQTAEKLSLAI